MNTNLTIYVSKYKTGKITKNSKKQRLIIGCWVAIVEDGALRRRIHNTSRNVPHIDGVSYLVQSALYNGG